jgi:hypothetical protein
VQDRNDETERAEENKDASVRHDHPLWDYSGKSNLCAKPACERKKAGAYPRGVGAFGREHRPIRRELGAAIGARVKMWGTSSPDDKLTGDLTNVIEAISIYDRGSDCLAAGKLAPGNLGLLQQYLP